MDKNIKAKYTYQYDYTKCMMMKMPMAFPSKDKKTSTVINTFEDALEIMKQVDTVTQGIQKIYYLVGWQYLGHDDKYPDFFEVNTALKRSEDKTAQDSFLWLYNEAKKYNSIVSVHINFNDAYDNAPSFDRFLKQNALIRKKDGTPHPIEKYNNRKCYKTSFKEYWDSGLFKEMFDRLLMILPLEDAKTVHVDNFQCYHNYNPDITIAEMQQYRRKMIQYVREKGIDLTSEFTYREHEGLLNRKPFGLPREHNKHIPMDTLGEIPASWWCTRMTRQEYVDIPPKVYSGGVYRDGLYKKYLYSNIHAEDVFAKYKQGDAWLSEFICQFATIQVPYHFLCQYERQKIEGHLSNERCLYNKNLISYNKNHRITIDGFTIKEESTLCMPLTHLQNTYIAYSKKGDSRSWHLLNDKYKSAKIYEVTKSGNVFLSEQEIQNASLALTIKQNQMLLIVLS
ncbi:MAG: endo-alpha-N-acetylgalactosaminidase family protein [Oscillospiraceae bacterium]